MRTEKNYYKKLFSKCFLSFFSFFKLETIVAEFKRIKFYKNVVMVVNS